MGPCINNTVAGDSPASKIDIAIKFVSNVNTGDVYLIHINYLKDS